MFFFEAGTIEALLAILENKNCTLSLFDESSSFYGSFGRYSPGGASYERGIYLELYNTKRSFKRDIKKDMKSEKKKIINPRVNLCLLGHPQFFIKVIRDEQMNRSDGLQQRFLTCCPKPVFYFIAEAIENAQKIQPQLSIKVLLLYVKLFHTQVIDDNKDVPVQRKAIKHKLDEMSNRLYNKLYSEYRKICETMNNNNEVFVSCMFAKAIIHLIKISAIINCVENAFKTIKEMEHDNKFILNKELENKFKQILRKLPTDIIITTDNLEKAKELLDYFILQRLIMAGYSCSMSFDSNEKNIQSLLNFITAKSELSINTSLATFILLAPGEILEVKEIRAAKKTCSEEISKLFGFLDEKGYGTYKQECSKRGKPKQTFIKKKKDLSNLDEQLLVGLEVLGIEIETYIKQFEAEKSIKFVENYLENFSNIILLRIKKTKYNKPGNKY